MESSNAAEISTDSQSPLSESWNRGLQLPELDGIRGIAILAVTIYRYCKEIAPESSEFLSQVKRFSPIGERGVDLFFVLSGFLITGILIRTRQKENYFKNFIIRRALRIFPLYFLALVICLFAIPNLLSAPSFRIPASEQVYLWTYTSNLRMSWLNEWCFGPLDHFWSLAVEEHFYLLWPAIVFWIAPKNLLKWSIAWVLLVLGTRTLLATQSAYDVAVDVHTFLRSDALCLGGIAAILVSLRKESRVLRMSAWVLTLSMLVVLIGVGATGRRYFGIPNTLVPLFFASAIYLIMQYPGKELVATILRWKFLRWLGKYSYGMYVVQLPLVTLLPATLFQSSLSGVTTSPVLQFAIYLAGMLSITGAIAWLSYHSIEKHFLKLKSRFQ